MKRKLRITDTGNLDAAAYSFLIEKGYVVRKLDSLTPKIVDTWIAEDDTFQYFSDDLSSLLALVTISEKRGISWEAKEEAAEEYMALLI